LNAILQSSWQIESTSCISFHHNGLKASIM
jgi:hypothetical protein